MLVGLIFAVWDDCNTREIYGRLYDFNNNKWEDKVLINSSTMQNPTYFSFLDNNNNIQIFYLKHDESGNNAIYLKEFK